MFFLDHLKEDAILKLIVVPITIIGLFLKKMLFEQETFRKI